MSNHRADIIKALALYDEAEWFKPITNGETLAFWEAQMADAEESLSEIVDDLGPVWCCRHMLFSEGL